MKKYLLILCAVAALAQDKSYNVNMTILGRVDASGAVSTAPAKIGTTAPATCVTGDLFVDTDATAGQGLLTCTSTNTWTVSGTGGVAAAGTLTGTTLAANVVTSSLTTVGTIGSGTWQGSVIGAAYGGAGTVSGVLKANGAGTVSAAAAGTDYLDPANLTTVGAIPYVSSSGVLNQDAELSYTVGTNTLNLVNATGIAGYGLSFTGAANQAVNFVASGASGYLQFGANGGNVFRVQPSGNTTFGGTTDGNYKLDVQASGSTGTLRVYDQTATTGTTLAVIQAGAGQSGNLLSVRTNGGVETFGISSAGETAQAQSGVTKIYTNYPNSIFANAMTLAWSSTTNAFGAVDLGLARNAAGVLEINSGTAGTLRDLKLRNITVMDTTATTGSTLAVIQAGAGQSGNLLSVRNNAGTEQFGVKLLSGSSGGVVLLNSAGEALYWPDHSTFRLTVTQIQSWSASSSPSGSADLGLARNAAGVLEVNNGTAGTYRDLIARRTQTGTVAVSALQTCNAGAAGSIQAVSDALAPAWGVTVANGGAAYALVTCNGTNWTVIGI